MKFRGGPGDPAFPSAYMRCSQPGWQIKSVDEEHFWRKPCTLSLRAQSAAKLKGHWNVCRFGHVKQPRRSSGETDGAAMELSCSVILAAASICLIHSTAFF